jgi:hypothetical protein
MSAIFGAETTTVTQTSGIIVRQRQLKATIQTSRGHALVFSTKPFMTTGDLLHFLNLDQTLPIISQAPCHQ